MPSVAVDARVSACSDSRVGCRERALPAVNVLTFWHVASLDAPTVAVVWSLAFAWIVGVRLPFWLPALIALTVWAVYVTDRLLDARAALLCHRPKRLRERHRFHWRQRRTLVPLALLGAAAAAWIVFTFMPPAARERDSLLAAASFLYFSRIHTGRKSGGDSGSRPFRLLPKECLVGLLFTTGCVLPALTRSHASQTWLLLIPAAFFALLAWLNCHAIDCWERAADSHRTLLAAAILLALTGAVLSVPFMFVAPRAAALLLCGAGSAVLLALLDRLRVRLSPLTLRAAADLVLLSPLALIAAAPFFSQ